MFDSAMKKICYDGQNGYAKSNYGCHECNIVFKVIKKKYLSNMTYNENLKKKGEKALDKEQKMFLKREWI